MNKEECKDTTIRFVSRKEYESIIVELVRLRADLDAERRIVAEQFSSRDEAVKKALEGNDKRLEGMNEFRNTLKDQTATFVPASVLDAKLISIGASIEALHQQINKDLKVFDDRIKLLEANSNRVGGRDSAINTLLVAGVAIVIAVIDLVLKVTGH